MITIKVEKHHTLDSALKVYKKNLEALRVIKQLQYKKKYIKPALKNKLIKSKIAHIKKMRFQDM